MPFQAKFFIMQLIVLQLLMETRDKQNKTDEER
jgi:hypothetical protein